MHVGPSKPSLQTQVNDSPATTQVPPFSHGFGRQLEFFAEGQGEVKKIIMRVLSVHSVILKFKQSHETSVGSAFPFLFFIFFGEGFPFSSEGICIPQLCVYCRCNHGF